MNMLGKCCTVLVRLAITQTTRANDGHLQPEIGSGPFTPHIGQKCVIPTSEIDGFECTSD